MSGTRIRALVTGLAMLGLGLFYLYITATLPRRGAVDASTIPYVLAIAMVLLGALQCCATLRRRPDRADAADDEAVILEEGPAPSGGIQSYAVVALTLVLVAGYTALMRPLGFPIATAIYLFLQFRLLTPKEARPAYGLYVLIAIITAITIFVLFRYGFNLLLPAGPLTDLLP